MAANISRREFIALAAAASAAGAARTVYAGIPRVRGVQLYTLRSLMALDVAQTLAAVARIGYREVEFAGYFDVPPAQLKKILDREGLSAPSAHMPLSQLRENFAQCLASAVELGHQYLVVPWLDEHERSPDDFKRLAEDLNRWGELAREAGIGVAYHNHDFEFASRNGQPMFDWLLQNTEPALVNFEADLYWMRAAGRDPLAYFSKYPGRFPLWHLKDMDSHGGMAALGQGTTDFHRILAAADKAGYRYGFVEHDNPEDPLLSLRKSYETTRMWVENG